MEKKFKIKYCKECVIPNTRPKINFDNNGVCSACNNAKNKKKINWEKRKIQFIKILKKHKKINSNNDYNCIVPVSGGKDSIYQLYIMKKKFKMRPLAITWKTPARTKRGEENLEALKNIGVDHIDFTINPKIINSITKKSFFKFGDSSYIDHLCIYNLIPNLAVKFNISLIIWGENMYFEYGGKKNDSDQRLQNLKIIKEHHILKNHQAEKWISKKIQKVEMSSFLTPNLKKLKSINYEPIYLGYYFPWDIKRNHKIAKQCGFKSRESGPIMGLYNESDLDCMNIVIHHYFKWLKFGFNRITDNASNEIRKKRLTRKKAIQLIKKYDGIKPPIEYIKKFCKQINISEKTFWLTANRFRNREIWKKNKKKQWYIKDWIGGKKVDNFPNMKLTKKEKNYFL
jgi:N-acetyl sugar amidotransferase